MLTLYKTDKYKQTHDNLFNVLLGKPQKKFPQKIRKKVHYDYNHFLGSLTTRENCMRIIIQKNKLLKVGIISNGFLCQFFPFI